MSGVCGGAKGLGRFCAPSPNFFATFVSKWYILMHGVALFKVQWLVLWGKKIIRLIQALKLRQIIKQTHSIILCCCSCCIHWRKKPENWNQKWALHQYKEKCGRSITGPLPSSDAYDHTSLYDSRLRSSSTTFKSRAMINATTTSEVHRAVKIWLQISGASYRTSPNEATKPRPKQRTLHHLRHHINFI